MGKDDTLLMGKDELTRRCSWEYHETLLMGTDESLLMGSHEYVANRSDFLDRSSQIFDTRRAGDGGGRGGLSSDASDDGLLASVAVTTHSEVCVCLSLSLPLYFFLPPSFSLTHFLSLFLSRSLSLFLSLPPFLFLSPPPFLSLSHRLCLYS